MPEMTFIKRLTAWAIIKLLDLTCQDNGKDVFLLVGAPLGFECPHCGYQTYHKVNKKDDWYNLSFWERFIGERSEDVCFNPGCNLNGIPWIYQKTPHRRPKVRIPNPDRNVTYSPNDPNVKLLTPNGDVILAKSFRVRIREDIKRRQQEFRFFN